MSNDKQVTIQDPTIAPLLEAGRTLKRRIFLFSTFIILFICVVAASLIIEERRAALDRAAGHAANLASAFEEQVGRVMDYVKGSVELIKYRIEKEGPAFDLYEWRALVPEIAASTIQVSIVGPDGRLRASTLTRTAKPVDLSDREYFRIHRDNPDAGLFIGRPVMGRVSNQVGIQVSKRLENPDGSFGGVVVFSLNPDFLTSLHRSIDLGKNGNMTLVGLDTIIRARFVSGEKAEDGLGVGESLGESRIFKDLAEQQTGTFTGACVLGGGVRIYHWRKVQGYPLVVTVGLEKEEALSDADRHAFLILSISSTAILLIALIASMLAREISQRVAHEIALFRKNAKLKEANFSLTEQHEALLLKSAQLAEERINLQQMNAQLSLAQEQSEMAHKAKNAFLANMNHELRTPLNAIIGFSEIMSAKLFGDLSDRYAEYAEAIHASGDQLLGVIDQVLDFARIEAGKLEISEGRTSLSAIVDTALRSVRDQAENEQIELSQSMPARPLSVRGDRTRLSQVLINLLSNAVKFTPSGGRVSVCAELEDSGGLCITVADSGIGMSAEEIEWAFEHFQQVDNSFSKRFAGIGLGLPLARQFAELHGGTLSIESEPDKGTKVMFRLPANRVIADAQEELAKPRAMQVAA